MTKYCTRTRIEYKPSKRRSVGRHEKQKLGGIVTERGRRKALFTTAALRSTHLRPQPVSFPFATTPCRGHPNLLVFQAVASNQSSSLTFAPNTTINVSTQINFTLLTRTSFRSKSRSGISLSSELPSTILPCLPAPTTWLKPSVFREATRSWTRQIGIDFNYSRGERTGIVTDIIGLNQGSRRRGHLFP